MSRSLIPCRACGWILGYTLGTGVLHPDANTVKHVDLAARVVTLCCPACGREFTVRAERIAMTRSAT